MQYSSMAAVSGIRVDVPTEELAAFCERHGIVAVWIFGSATRDDFGSESDVDLIVEFAPGMTPGLSFFTLGEELEPVFGRRVDVLTRGSLKGPLGEKILAAAVPVYERN